MAEQRDSSNSPRCTTALFAAAARSRTPDTNGPATPTSRAVVVFSNIVERSEEERKFWLTTPNMPDPGEFSDEGADDHHGRRQIGCCVARSVRA